MTLSPGIWASALMISSVRPSLKYSCSRSPLMFAKGSTATDGLGAGSPGRASAPAVESRSIASVSACFSSKAFWNRRDGSLARQRFTTGERGE